jgi:hypothetical protein
MDIELRPLSLGELMDRTFQLYRARFVLFFGIATVASAIEMIWSLARVLEASALTRSHLSLLTTQAITSGTATVSWAVTFGIAGLAMAATNRAVTRIHEGKPTGIAASYGEVRPHWLRYMWLNVLTFLLAWWLVILIVAASVAAVLVARRTSSLPQANIVSFLYGVMGLLIFLALPLCIWLTLRYALANPACVTEQIGVRKALKRSVLLSKSMRGKIFVLLLVIFIAQMVLVTALTAPVLASLIRHPGHMPVPVTAYLLVVTFLSSALIKPVYSIGLTLFYYDARIRKEGFDVEWMLDHAPATSSPEISSSLSGLLPG